MLDFVKLLFDSVWQLFSIKWPGFDFPIGYAFLGAAFAAIALKTFGFFLGLGIGSSVTGAVSSYQKRAARISKSREGDEK